MKLKNITFVLENCDSITIDGKYIGHFLVTDIRTEIGRVACNSFMKVDVANTIVIEINKKANGEYFQFEQSHLPEFKEEIFKRLKNPDVTSIQFDLVDDDKNTEHYEYYTNWIGNSDYYNEAQTSFISDAGHLYLIISEGKTVSDFFTMTTINNPQSMERQFSRFDIGNT